MAAVHTSVEINAPMQHVWDVVTDLDHLGDWVSIHKDFPATPPSEVSQGTTFEQTLAVAGTSFKVEWTAETVDRPTKLRWTGTGPIGTTASTTYSLTETDGKTHFDYENDFHFRGGKIGGAAAGVVSGRADREADESLAKLKQLAEA